MQVGLKDACTATATDCYRQTLLWTSSRPSLLLLPRPNMTVLIFGDDTDCGLRARQSCRIPVHESVKLYRNPKPAEKQEDSPRSWKPRTKQLYVPTRDDQTNSRLYTWSKDWKSGEIPDHFPARGRLGQIYGEIPTQEGELHVCGSGKCWMERDHVAVNIRTAINFLVSPTKKGWQNIGSVHIKPTIGPAYITRGA